MFNPKLFEKCISFIEASVAIPGGNYKISSDTRKITSKNIFIALKGTSFDGHDYLEQAVDKGAALVVCEKNERSISVSRTNSDIPFVFVKDCYEILKEVGKVRIDEWSKNGGVVIGITGSNGKTTHKEMLLHLFSKCFPGKVIATKGNLNNHIGVPLTILDIEDEHRFALIEMGTNHPGEIKTLCDIASPVSGLITNIGESHVEFLVDKDGVFAEKKCLYESIRKNSNDQGAFIINADDEYLARLEPYPGSISFGEKNGDIRINIANGTLQIQRKNEQIEILNNSLIERFNFFNLAACFLLASKFCKDEFKLISAAETFVLPRNNRCVWIEDENGKFFLDAYNANPSSMRVSLSSFFEAPGYNKDACFILGDMNELGERTRQLHQEIGTYLKQAGAKNVFFVGRYSDFYKEGFGEGAEVYDTKQAFEKVWGNLKKHYKLFFIKGSRSLQLESLVDIT